MEKTEVSSYESQFNVISLCKYNMIHHFQSVGTFTENTSYFYIDKMKNNCNGQRHFQWKLHYYCDFILSCPMPRWPPLDNRKWDTYPVNNTSRKTLIKWSVLFDCELEQQRLTMEKLKLWFSVYWPLLSITVINDDFTYLTYY